LLVQPRWCVSQPGSRCGLQTRGVEGTFRIGALIGMLAKEISQTLGKGSVDAWRPDGVVVSESRREARHRHSGYNSTAHHPTPRILTACDFGIDAWSFQQGHQVARGIFAPDALKELPLG
jgi:hypothetical protein